MNPHRWRDLHRVVAIVFGVLIGLACAAAAHASFTIGVGAGTLKIPENSGSLSRAAPDGESEGSLLLFWTGTANATLGFGVSYSGYGLTKEYPDTSGTIEARWTVTELSGHLEMRRPLGRSRTSPSVALRFGVAIMPIKVEATAPSAELPSYDAESEIRIGPYLGADVRVPLGRSRFALFATTSKSFVSSTLLREDMDVGPWMIGAGAAYVFRAHFE